MTPGELAEALGALPVEVQSSSAHQGRGQVWPYEDPLGRPTGALELRGRGHVGRGECLAWTEDAQAAFVARTRGMKCERGSLVSIAAKFDGYVRAAVEGALIDLALRQNGLTMASLAGAGRPVRYAVSFDGCSTPAARLERIRRGAPGASFKVDVSPQWSQAEAEMLSATSAVAVLDFKGAGTAVEQQRLRALFPDAYFEDAPVADGRTARDQPIKRASDVARFGAEAINIKAGRMGGFLEALLGLEESRLRGNPTYFGGQFELGVARDQARRLAALFTPEATNDLAPLPEFEEDHRAPSPLVLDLEEPGFR